MTATDPSAFNVSIGSLTGVPLVEVTIDPNTYQSTPVAGGSCYTVTTLDWNTMP